MRQRIFQSTLAFLLLMPGALAQTGDWQSVMDLQPGTTISVKAGHFFAHNLCTVQSVTDETLVCERIQRGPGAWRTSLAHVFTYNRKSVREVRLEHSDEANTALGVAVGAGAGAAIGAAAVDPNSDAIINFIGGIGLHPDCGAGLYAGSSMGLDRRDTPS
jgi:hypothetical protein